MVKDVMTYPQTPGLGYNVDIRLFNEELFELLQDLKDTIEANNLNALAAFQIGSPKGVVVVKDEEGNFIELVNMRILTREGKVTTRETTAYFPGLSAEIERYAKIKVLYEDREGKQQFLNAEGDLAITIQRKYDYIFGGNIRMRMDEEEKKLFDAKLEFGTDVIDKNDCPTTFKRDILLKAFKYILIASGLGIVISFFLGEENLALLVQVENYAMWSMLGLIVAYFFYAQYEGKQYKHCTSCQIGNIIGTCVIALSKLLGVFVLYYLLV